MLRLAYIILLIAGIVSPDSDVRAQSTGPATPSTQRQPANQRVILRVSRTVEISGHLQHEDDDTVMLRTTKGEIENFAKSRIAQIVRLVDPQPDQTGTVFMRDGQIREGIIVEDEFDHVLVEIQGIRAKLKRDTVSHVVLKPTFEQRYAEYKSAMQPGNYDAQFTLSKWLMEQRRYELAKKQLLDILNNIQMPEATQLLKLVEAQLAMTGKPDEPPTTKPDDTNPPPNEAPGENDSAGDNPPKLKTGSVILADLLPSQLLTREDVNIIRVYELDFDHSSRVVIAPDTVRELIERYGTNKLIPPSQTGRNELFRAASDRPLDVVRLMFQIPARDLYSKIQVNSEPYALNLFRQRVHDTWLLNNCATTQCHGGPYGGRFFLHRKNYKDERVRYTNLLILDRLKLDPEWPLINYETPEDSLLIQYGLPRQAARKPHPEVTGWKSAFSPINPKLRDDVVTWIKAMMQPRPNYPVAYEPPVLKTSPAPVATSEDPTKPPR